MVVGDVTRNLREGVALKLKAERASGKQYFSERRRDSRDMRDTACEMLGARFAPIAHVDARG